MPVAVRSYTHARPENPTGDEKDWLTPNITNYIVWPIIAFHSFSTLMLLGTLFAFFHYESELNLDGYVWVALIAAIAGIPFTFARIIRYAKDIFVPS